MTDDDGDDFPLDDELRDVLTLRNMDFSCAFSSAESGGNGNLMTPALNGSVEDLFMVSWQKLSDNTMTRWTIDTPHGIKI